MIKVHIHLFSFTNFSFLFLMIRKLFQGKKVSLLYNVGILIFFLSGVNQMSKKIIGFLGQENLFLRLINGMILAVFY